MEDKTSTLRLIYPQWQGGIVNHWMPDLPADDASRGYYLGAQLLNILAPPSPQKTVEVPISLDINDRDQRPQGYSETNKSSPRITARKRSRKDCHLRGRMFGKCRTLHLSGC